MIAVTRRTAASEVATAPRTTATAIAAALAATIALSLTAPPSRAEGVRLSLAQIGLAQFGLEPAGFFETEFAQITPTPLDRASRADALADDLAAGLAPLLSRAAPTQPAPSALAGVEQDAPLIVVATRALRKGALIQPGDVVLRPAPAAQNGLGGFIAPADALTDPARAIGQEARASIYAGRAIRAGELGPRTLVRRNQIVGVTYRHGALTLRTEGRALDEGGLGERIRILNLDSRRTIFASISGPAETEVR